MPQPGRAGLCGVEFEKIDAAAAQFTGQSLLTGCMIPAKGTRTGHKGMACFSLATPQDAATRNAPLGGVEQAQHGAVVPLGQLLEWGDGGRIEQVAQHHHQRTAGQGAAHFGDSAGQRGAFVVPVPPQLVQPEHHPRPRQAGFETQGPFTHTHQAHGAHPVEQGKGQTARNVHRQRVLGHLQ